MNQQFEAARLWYNSLPHRDRMLVIATSVIVLIMLFYLIIWEPVHEGLNQQQQQYQSQKNIVLWMQEAAAEVQSLKRSGAKTVTSSNQPVSLIIEQSAKISGLKDNIGKLESSGKDGARTKLNGASFNQILIWLNTLEKRHGVTVSSASIERGDKIGTVNARLSFNRS